MFLANFAGLVGKKNPVQTPQTLSLIGQTRRRTALILLMQAHREFQVVTPRTLDEFQGETLVLPDVRLLNEQEQNWIKQYVKQGKKLVITGDGAMALDSQPNVIRFPQCPGKAYNAALEANFEHTNPQMQKTILSAGKFMAAAISRTKDANCAGV